MIATTPASEASKRSFYFVITVASLLVGAAIGAHFAPARTAPRPTRPRVWTERPVAVPAPAPAPAPVEFAQPPPSLTGMPSCDLYLERMDSFVACDRLPQAARDAARQSLDQVRAAWTSLPDTTAEVKQQVDDACRQAVDALAQSMDAMGCPL